MQRGIGHERNVSLSLRLSVKRVNCDKTKETCAKILTPRKSSIHLVFRHEEWLYRIKSCEWNLGANWPHSFENANFQLIFARSASVVTQRKSSIITNSESTTRFPMSLRLIWYVAPKPPREGFKNAKWPFAVEKRTSFEENLLQSLFVCVKTVSSKVVRHSLAYLSVHKWFVENVLFYVKISPKLTHLFQKRRFSINVRS